MTDYKQLTIDELRSLAGEYNYYRAYYALEELNRRGEDISSLRSVASFPPSGTVIEGWDACCRASGRD